MKNVELGPVKPQKEIMYSYLIYPSICLDRNKRLFRLLFLMSNEYLSKENETIEFVGEAIIIIMTMVIMMMKGCETI